MSPCEPHVERCVLWCAPADDKLVTITWTFYATPLVIGIDCDTQLRLTWMTTDGVEHDLEEISAGEGA